MFSKRGKMLLNVKQKRENAMKCLANEGKCYEMFSKTAIVGKCSAREGICYEMFSKRGKILWNVQQKRENVQQKRENAMKCSAKEGKCLEMFSKKGKCYEIFSKKLKMQ